MCNIMVIYLREIIRPRGTEDRADLNELIQADLKKQIRAQADQ